MNLYPKAYHHIGEITLKDDYKLKQERLLNEGIDPWLFLVFDKKGERRFTFFYKIEQPTKDFHEKSFKILMHFIVEEGGIIDTKK